ncbi:ABC transporter substrate-binding protein [Salipiger sp. P9]|uniref:ABC transporter substrate-binding protein n=1 Tax=Salipiger pentaromativorans TaxID=2943193 RepID=UPI0021589741|nr:ABC transporter substrate-binding protein [Salipiger pentaromativorans]MCR8549427.1 ABC transporter substrate-binding protein [Salipiger pentaromativorans]
MLEKTQGRRTAIAAAFLALTLGGGASAEGAAVKVGFAADLTGACAALAEDGLNGATLAAAELNDAGGILGRPVELIVRDTQTKPDEGAKVARELITDEAIDVLTGVCSSAVMLAESAVSKELKTPFYAAIGSTQRANIELFQPYFWQVQANATMEAYAAAEYVAKKADWKRISTLGSDYEWGHTSVAAFTERLKELHPDVEFADPIYAKVGETAMAPYITATLAQRPDAVYAPLFGPSLSAVLKQGQGFGFFQRSALVTLMTVDTLQSQGAAMPDDNVFGIARAPFFALEQTPEVTAFIDSYRAAFGEYPTDWAISAYDGLKFYAAAAEHAGTVEAEPLIAAVGEITYDGLRERGLRVRALDGQMNAPSYVGKASRVEGYAFPILTEVEKFDGAPLMPAEEFILKARAAAQ